MLDREEADRVLKDVDLVPVLEGPVLQAKELERQLLEHDIPVALVKPDPGKCCSPGGGCGCGSKLQLLVREEDVPKIASLMQQDWLEAVRREGIVDGAPVRTFEAAESGEVPCPACGHAAPLAEGACADCGLVLE